MTNKEIAENLIAKATEFGFSISTSGSVLCVSKVLPTNSPADYAQAESYASTLLSMIKMTSPGSIWGTDGASIGGYAALQTGVFRMNKSGCSARVISQINKLKIEGAK